MKPTLTTNTKLVKITKLFIDEIYQSGLTKLSSRELQLKTLNYLLDAHEYDRKNYFELSKQLMIPESKLKKMIYEIDLEQKNRELFNADQESVLKKETELLENAIDLFKIKNGIVIIEVRSEFAQNLLKEKLRTIHHFSDSSFNSDLVKMELVAFVELLNELLPDSIKTKEFKARFEQYELNNDAENIVKALKEINIVGIPAGKLAASGISLITKAFKSFDRNIKYLTNAEKPKSKKKT